MAGLGTFDFSEFQKFGDDLKAMERAWPKFLKECTEELANRLLAKAVLRTPVRDGDLRRGWTISQINMTSTGAEIEVFNSVLYAAYVEYGHRQTIGRFVPAIGKRLKVGWVEGQFMLTLSTPELERELPAIVERRLERFITRYLGR
ncbi:HK97 gp10 family phage protein [Paenibacillus sp. LX16]|uniref:HK97 gp10 family phage protein n=1 Tax=Paenibacillus sp. LX16 TaxID=1740264 RepID=UPI002E29D166|nr:HK97 gp10 family phage protein [Paenibacillus sp. LX16]